MASARAALRSMGGAVWYLGWAGLVLGVLLLLVGRKPSPGSEWNAGAAGGLLLVPLGVLGVLLGGVIRRAFRPRGESTPAESSVVDSHGPGGAPPR